jgi:HEAT repeat protein
MDLGAASVDELFALARSAQDEDAYWACVTELHGRAEDRTFKLAEVLCESFAAGERCLGADVLAQLGTAPGLSAAEGPFASDSGLVLIRMLEDEEEPAVLASVAVGLGHLRDERAIGRLAEFASHPDVEVRRSVVHGLMGHDDDRAVAALIALSRDDDPGVRDWATFSLGAQIDRESPELRDALAARLEDPNREARGEAIAGLARRGDARALEAALAVAAGPDGRSPTLDEAVVLLGATTGDPRLVEHLERLRDDPEFAAEHREELERALARCSSGTAGAS